VGECVHRPRIQGRAHVPGKASSCAAWQLGAHEDPVHGLGSQGRAQEPGALTVLASSWGCKCPSSRQHALLHGPAGHGKSARTGGLSSQLHARAQELPTHMFIARQAARTEARTHCKAAGASITLFPSTGLHALHRSHICELSCALQSCTTAPRWSQQQAVPSHTARHHHKQAQQVGKQAPIS